MEMFINKQIHYFRYPIQQRESCMKQYCCIVKSYISKGIKLVVNYYNFQLVFSSYE